MTKKTVAASAVTPAADPVGRFEDALKDLEQIVQQLERGDLRLEQSLDLFSRGVALGRECRTALEQAELKVKTLLQVDAAADDDDTLDAFDGSTDDDDLAF